jgi:O-antigen ligase
VAQLAGGPQSPLRWYRNTNELAAVGQFANSNHLASLLVLCLPIAIARAAAALRPGGGAARPGVAIVVGVLAAVLLAGVATTRSRAGIALAMLAIAAMLPVLWSQGVHRRVPKLALAAGGLAAVLVIQFALFAVLQRFARDPLADERFVYARHTLDAARDYAPVGSGIGTFPLVYPVYEAADPRGMSAARVNHAHDDWLELWLEGGWLAGAAMLGFVAWLAATLRRAWRATTGTAAALPARALAIAALVPFLHSWGDYPLRTSAMLAATGLVLGLLVALGADRHRGAGS